MMTFLEFGFLALAVVGRAITGQPAALSTLAFGAYGLASIVGTYVHGFIVLALARYAIGPFSEGEREGNGDAHNDEEP